MTEAEVAKLVEPLHHHLADMKARISNASIEIREREAALRQLEKERWALERNVDRMASALVKADQSLDSRQKARPGGTSTT